MKTIDILFKSFFIAGLCLPFIVIAFFNPSENEVTASLYIGVISSVCLVFIYLISKPLKD